MIQGQRASRATTVAPWPARSAWGLFPPLSLVVTAGLFCVALANIGARTELPWAEAAFFGGLLLIVLPAALRLVRANPSRAERVALIALLALALFATKVLRDPWRMGDYDEFLHWRTAQDMILTGAVFSPNTLLGVSPYYPGLELVTAAIAQMASIPIFEAGLITLAAGRLVFLLALFLFFEIISSDSRVAGIASLIYMLNPRFLYFDSQFAYESLALPLAAIVLYLLARRGHTAPARWLGLTVLILVMLPSVVITHHVTSAMLTAFLLAWGAAAVIIGRSDRSRAKPGRIAVIMTLMIIAWTVAVATATVGYLGPAVSSSFAEMLRLMGGDLAPRELFQARGGVVAPIWERMVGSGSAAAILALLPMGLLVVWSRYRTNSAMVALALVAAAYPASLVARLTRVGAEVATRTPEFLFLGIGIVVALAFARFSYQGRRRFGQYAIVTVFLVVVSTGGVIVGMPAWARLPGPYLVSADVRSIEPEGIAAAEWTRELLGPDNPIVADRVNRLLMSTYGQQHMITTYETRLPFRRLYLEPEIGPAHRRILYEGGVQYLVADRRMTTGLPMVGIYIDRGEESVVGRHETPLNPELLDKFDRQPEVSRVYDSGNIQIYDVSDLAAPEEDTR
jgi:hypothetical protein